MGESVEITVARLDERLEGVINVMQQMADDQKSMAESYAKLVENQQKLGLVELDVTSLKKSNEKLWEKVEGLQKVNQQRLDEELKTKNKWIAEIAKVAIAVAAGAIAAKYGIHIA